MRSLFSLWKYFSKVKQAASNNAYYIRNDIRNEENEMEIFILSLKLEHEN